MTIEKQCNSGLTRFTSAMQTKVAAIYVGGVATGINLSLAIEQPKENLNWQFGIIGALMCGAASILSILKLPSTSSPKVISLEKPKV